MSEGTRGPELNGELCCHGWVMHSRTHPVNHRFTYQVWMLLVDVDASAQPWPRWLVSWDRGHLLSRSQVDRAIEDAGMDVQPTRIFALTQPRSAGFSFNPVNFYFCYGEDATASRSPRDLASRNLPAVPMAPAAKQQASSCTLQAILCDVRNTPWNEKHCYVLDARGQHGEYAFEPRKELHVSPFLSMQGGYRWRIRLTGERIEVAMHFAPQGRSAFVATLSLRAEPLTKRAVMRALMRAPAQSLATLVRIYRQALRLYLKGAPFHPHPGNG
ncbi:MAG: DUF1365 domain-containing protein [Gammaproteobacteria bacterium]|nr:DUF1365 domain-containing protein [Gammaproteobacteria bacterium]